MDSLRSPRVPLIDRSLGSASFALGPIFPSALIALPPTLMSG